MTQVPEHETQVQAAQPGAPDALPKVKAGEAGLAWATPDGESARDKEGSAAPLLSVDGGGAAGGPQAVLTDTPQTNATQTDTLQSEQASDGQDTPTTLLARLRRGRQAGGGGTAQERAEQALPPEDALRALLHSAPLNVRLHGESDAPLVDGERRRALLREPRPAGPIHEDDFKQESDLRPDDLQEVRAERTELLRAYFRARRAESGQPVSMPAVSLQAVSMQDFQQSFVPESGWFGRSAWLERHLLTPWSVQRADARSEQAGPEQLGTVPDTSPLMMAPRGRARFGSFVRVPQAGGQTGNTPGREALEAQTRRPEVEEALAKARLEVVRAATARLFADWEQEADDLPPEERQAQRQTRRNS